MSNTVSTTINIPKELIDNAQELIHLGKVNNLEEFITLAVKNQLKTYSATEINELEDPILGLGKNPVSNGIKDASENLDQYIYHS